MMPTTTTTNTANGRLIDAYYAQCEAIIARALADEREVTFAEVKKLRGLARAVEHLLACVTPADTKDR